MDDLKDLQETEAEDFVLPQEALDEVAAAAAGGAPPGELSRERLDELNADPTLAKPEELALVKEYVLGGRTWPEASAPATETAEEVAEREANEAAAAGTPEPEVPEAGATTPEDEPEDDTAIHRSTLDAVATLRAEHKAKIDKLNEIIDAPEPEDEYSPDYKEWDKAQRKAMREKSKLQDEFHEKFADATLAAQAQTVAVREADRTMKAFDTVSAKTPEVKLDRPFKVANAAYAGWLKDLVAKSGIIDGTDAEKMQAAYTKFQADPEFAKTVPAPKDLKQVQMLNEARMLAEKSNGTLDIDSAVTVVLHKRGLLTARTGAAATAASQASAKKIQDALGRAATAPATAQVGAGGAKAPKVLSVPVDGETAQAYLTNLLDKKAKGRPLTPFETRYEDQAKQHIGIDKIR